MKVCGIEKMQASQVFYLPCFVHTSVMLVTELLIISIIGELNRTNVLKLSVGVGNTEGPLPQGNGHPLSPCINLNA